MASYSHDTPLHIAASCGDEEKVRKFLKSQQYKVDVVNSDKQTPLHLACANGHLVTVDLLVNNFNASIGALDNEGLSPLLHAAKSNHIQIVIILILLSMFGRRISKTTRIRIPYEVCHVERSHTELLEEVVFEYFNNPQAQLITVKIIRELFDDVIDDVENCECKFFPLFLASSLGLQNLFEKLIVEKGTSLETKGFFGLSLLHCACFGGHTQLIEHFVDHYKLNLNARSRNGRTIIHYACFGDHTELIEKLIINYQLDPALTDEKDNTALHIATMTGQVETVRYLIIKHKVVIDCRNNQDLTPLCLAARNGHLYLVTMLIDEFKCSSQVVGYHGRTLLHKACQGGNVKLIDKLIKVYGLDPMARDDSGNTPLHIAAIDGQVEIVKHFVTMYKHSVDIDSTDDEGSTPLCLTAQNGHLNLISMFLNDFKCSSKVKGCNQQNLVHYAARGDHKEVIDMLVKVYEVNPKMKDNNGNTPLHVAALNGGVKSVEHLIKEHNIEKESTNNCQSTPLCLAASRGQLKVAHMLLYNFKCSAAVKGYRGRTLLHYACKDSNIELIRMLKCFGVDPTTRDDYGDTPLHIAAVYGQVKTVEYLITECSVERDSTNYQKSTPLCSAVSKGHVHLAQVLVKDFRCCPLIKGHNGQSLLHYACQCGHTEMFDMLITDHNLQIEKDHDGNTPLHLAVMNGHIDMVQHLFSKYIDCFITNAEKVSTLSCAARINYGCDGNIKGQTLLHCACQNGHVKLVDILVEDYNFDLTARDVDGNTPLHVAVLNCQVETVKHLVTQHKVDVHCTNNHCATPLMVAALHGYIDVIENLVTGFHCVPEVKDVFGKTLLHYACEGGHTKLVDNLISKYKLDIFGKDNDGNTPLHIAALHGQAKTVKYLINRHKVVKSSKNNIESTPLWLAARNGHLEVVKILYYSECNERNLLHFACRGDHTKLLDEIVSEHQIDLTQPEINDDDGNTPLHLAAMEGHIKTVKHLIIKYKVEVDLTNKDNSSSLCTAVSNGKEHVMKVLIEEFGCNPAVKAYRGRTLLHYACKFGNIELLDKMVTEYHLDVNRRDDDGNTLLHMAALSGQVEVVNHLIMKYDAEKGDKNSYNSTPLCVAARNNHLNVIRLLVDEFQCNPEATGYNGQTLLYYAYQGGHLQLVDTLKELYGLNATLRDDDHNTPVHVVCRTGKTEMLKPLLSGINSIWTVFQSNKFGNTPLHTAALYKHTSCVKVLLNEYKAPLFVRNNDGKTASDLHNDKVIVEELKSNISQQIQSTYKELDELARKEFSGEKHLTRLFVVGHSGAGKSTLIDTLKKEGFFYIFKRTIIEPHTAGIIPTTFNSTDYGRMIFYDFAGDSEYYTSHAAVLESVDTSMGMNIYLILCDLSQSREFITRKFSYWFSFLSCNIRSIFNSIILPVGSRADKLSSDKEMLGVVDNLSQNFSAGMDNLQVKEKSVVLDCRDKGNVFSRIKDLVKKYSTSVHPVRLTLETSTLLGLLRKDFENVTACEVHRLISHIVMTKIPLPVNPSLLYPLVRELHNFGFVLLIEKQGDAIENHLIILNIPIFTSDVHSKLFSKSAKKNLAEHTDPLKLSVGIIPESLLKVVLPNYVTKDCLLKLQYCQEIENLHVEEDHTLLQSQTASQEPLLFFPALCELKIDKIQWTTEVNEHNVTLGWYVKCDGRFDHFPTRFLHVLIVRLSRSFALKQSLPVSRRPSIVSIDSVSSMPNSPTTFDFNRESMLEEVYESNHRCHVWSTGLHWVMRNGVEVFVDLPKDAENKELVVVTRSCDGSRAECANILQKVVQKVIEAKVEFCHSITPSVYLLDSSSLKRKKFTDARKVPRFTLQEVNITLAEGSKNAVSVDGSHCSSPRDLANLTRWTMSYWSKS